MLTIRLSRIGKKNKPMYRLTVSEKAKDPYGRALEILGSYNPYTKDLQVKVERIEHWLSQGAQMSDSVNNLLLTKEIIKGEKAKSFKANTKKQLKKKEEAQKAEKEAKKAEEEAKKAEKEASAAAEAESKEAPVEAENEIKEEKKEEPAA